MSIAVISDIHGNLEALEAVLVDIGDKEIYCLGDIVGYYANPKECIALVKKRGIKSTKGNHDHSVVVGDYQKKFNEHAFEALRWTERELDVKDINFLKRLPYTKRLRDGELILLHGDLLKPSDFNYIQYWSHCLKNFEKLEPGQSLFVGHLHKPDFSLWYPEGQAPCHFSNEGDNESLRKTYKHIINVGSVGQPRDRNPDACWVEVFKKKVKLHRVEYDVEKVQEKILLSSMPSKTAQYLAGRLPLGR